MWLRTEDGMGEVLEHLGRAWTTVLGVLEKYTLRDRLTHAVQLAPSAGRVLSSEFLR